MNGKIFCRHNWRKMRLVMSYHDYSGYKVGVFECRCTKCGKVKERKYY